MNKITYDPETEKRYAELHAKVLDFMAPIAVSRRIPTLIESYGAGPERTALSNRQPTEEMKKLLRIEGNTDGKYASKEHAIIVNASRNPSNVAGREAHETGHAAMRTANRLVTVGECPARPGTLAWIAQEYLGTAMAAAKIAKKVHIAGWALPPDPLTLRADMDEFYAELAGNHVQPEYSPDRLERELKGFERIKADLAAGKAADLECALNALNLLHRLEDLAYHLPASAATLLVREYGTAEAVVKNTPAFSLDKEEVWNYISNLDIR